MQQDAKAGEPLLSRDEARPLTARALALSPADQTRGAVQRRWSGNPRFADCGITASAGTTSTAPTGWVTFRTGRASSSPTTAR